MAKWKGIVGLGLRPDDFAGYVETVRFGSWRPEFVVLHNTASPRLDQWHAVAGAERMRNLEHYYRDVRQWSGGPHLFVADDLIWVFTPLTVPGVHSPSWNGVAWGVEMVGDFDAEDFENGAGAAVRRNTASVLATLHAFASLDATGLRLHREDPKTTHACPGRNVAKADVVARVHDEIALRNGDGPPLRLAGLSSVTASGNSS